MIGQDTGRTGAFPGKRRIGLTEAPLCGHETRGGRMPEIYRLVSTPLAPHVHDAVIPVSGIL